MEVSVAEFTSGVERYLDLVGDEKIVITRGGQYVAQLTPPPRDKLSILESLSGILPPTASLEEARTERIGRHEAGL